MTGLEEDSSSNNDDEDHRDPVFFNGQQLFDAFTELEFTGASGNVVMDHESGSRLSSCREASQATWLKAWAKQVLVPEISSKLSSCLMRK